MLNNFKFNPIQPRKNSSVTNDYEKKEKIKRKSNVSWGEVVLLIGIGMFFLFALTQRILFEYRTDDFSNIEVVVGSCTFKNNKLISYDGSEAVVNIPAYYTVEDELFGITEIEMQVFYGNSNIIEISMPNQITKVGLFAFRECVNLQSITLSNNLESLGDSAFWNCKKLTTINLPTKLKNIEPYAFWNTSITTIDIPESVKNIGLGAFNMCSKLETVYIRSNEVVSTYFTSVYQAFSNCPNLQKIYVPQHLVEEYKNHSLWSLYGDKFEAIGGNYA